jgi:HK97 family phage prohead protease
MPWHIANDQPDCDGYAVVKDDTGETIPGGCHTTLAEAEDHLTALNIAESGMRAVDLAVPQYIRDAAARGLELRADGYGGDGLVERTIREARAMARGEITSDKVIRANAWAARHAVDLDANQNTDPDADGWPGNGAVAHYLWGIDPTDPEPARAWFANKSTAIAADEQDARMTDVTIIDTDTDTVPTFVRDNLSRTVEFRAMPSEDGLTLTGYAAVFNEWTDIDSWEGTFRERIAPGAFKRTLGQRMPVLQFDHGSHPLIGSIPLGRITSIVEDERGLKVKARLSDNWLVEPVRDAIRDGAIDGMSFRFSVPANGDKIVRGKDGILERTINEVALYEVGPVVFPAYEQTTVGVRSRQALDALQDPEVRSEIARILANGTDITSLATDPDPIADHSGSIAADSDIVHSEPAPRTRAQREALVALYLK